MTHPPTGAQCLGKLPNLQVWRQAPNQSPVGLPVETCEGPQASVGGLASLLSVCPPFSPDYSAFPYLNLVKTDDQEKRSLVQSPSVPALPPHCHLNPSMGDDSQTSLNPRDR